MQRAYRNKARRDNAWVKVGLRLFEKKLKVNGFGVEERLLFSISTG
jgi:hypothetical protein